MIVIELIQASKFSVTVANWKGMSFFRLGPTFKTSEISLMLFVYSTKAPTGEAAKNQLKFIKKNFPSQVVFVSKVGNVFDKRAFVWDCNSGPPGSLATISRFSLKINENQ